MQVNKQIKLKTKHPEYDKYKDCIFTIVGEVNHYYSNQIGSPINYSIETKIEGKNILISASPEDVEQV